MKDAHIHMPPIPRRLAWKIVKIIYSIPKCVMCLDRGLSLLHWLNWVSSKIWSLFSKFSLFVTHIAEVSFIWDKLWITFMYRTVDLPLSFISFLEHMLNHLQLNISKRWLWTFTGLSLSWPLYPSRGRMSRQVTPINSSKNTWTG